MNIFAVIVLLAVGTFAVVQIVGTIKDVKKRKVDEKKVPNLKDKEDK